MDYTNIRQLELQCKCCQVTQDEHDELYAGSVRADKRKINALVKRMLPDLYDELALDFYNPYKYYRTKTHLILVHSSIDYFIRFS